MTKTKLTISFIWIALLLCLGFMAFFELSFTGAPDGYISDYHRARNWLLRLVLVLDSFYVGSLFFFYKFKKEFLCRKLYWVLGVQLIILLCLWIFDFYLYTTLDHGQGG